MEIGAAKAIGADACAAGRTLWRVPIFQFMIQIEWSLREINVGVGLLRIEGRGQHLVIDRHRRLEQAGRACARLEVANVALGRAQRNRTGACAHAKNPGQALHLHHVAHARARAVRFHQRRAGWVKPCIVPGALNGEQLPLRVGGCDALALAVARAGHAADDGVNPVAIAHGVGQPLEQKRAGAFAHDEAVGPCAKGAAAAVAQCADFAELDEARGAHIAVHAAGNHRVGLAGVERLARGLHCGEGGGAGGVGNEAGAAQIEHIGHAPGHNVGQLARHGVFGNLRQRAVHGRVPLRQNAGARGRGQRCKLGRAMQPVNILGPVDACGGDVLHLTAHRRAQDDARAVGVQGALRVAVICHGLGGDGDGPLLALIHGCGHLGRHAETLPVKLEVAHPAADLAVGLVGG